MALEDYPSLGSLLELPEVQSRTPEQKIDLTKGWADKARETIDESLVNPEDYRRQQELYSGVDKISEQTINSERNNIIKSRLESHWPGMTARQNQFIEEFNKNTNNLAAYEDDDFKGAAKDLLGVYKQYPSLNGQRSISSSVTDAKGRALATLGVRYDDAGNPMYANVFFNQYDRQSDNLLEASNLGLEGTVEKVMTLSGSTTKEEQGISGGDTIRFPKNFNGKKYYEDSLNEKITNLRREIESDEEKLRSSYDLQNADYLYGGSANQFRINELGTSLNSKYEELSKLNEEFNKSVNAGDDHAQSFNAIGSNEYIRNQIEQKIKDGNPKYQSVGQSTIDGLIANSVAQAQSLPYRFFSGIAGQASGALGLLTDDSPTAGGLAKQASNWLDEKSRHLQAQAEFISGNEGPSRMEITNPEGARKLTQLTSAVQQGLQIAAVSAVNPSLMQASIFGEVAGQKYSEIDAIAEAFRREGKYEDADYITKHRNRIAALSGLVEYGSEKIGGPGERLIPSAAQIAQRGGFFSKVAKSVGSESMEGIPAEIGGAVVDYENRLISQEERDERMSAPNLFEAAFYEGVGAVIPSGARSAIEVYLQRHANRGEQRATAPITQQNIPPINPVANEVATPTIQSIVDDIVIRNQQRDAEQSGQPQIETIEETTTNVNPIAASVTEATIDQNNQAIASEELEVATQGEPGEGVELDAPESPARVSEVQNRERYANYLFNRYLNFMRSLSQKLGTTEGIGIGVTARDPNVKAEIPGNIYVVKDKGDTPLNWDNAWLYDEYTLVDKKQGPYAGISDEQKEQYLKELEISFSNLFGTPNKQSNGVSVTDITGRTVFITADDARQKIENGEIDPNLNYFYLLGTDTGTQENNSWLWNNVPGENIVNSGHKTDDNFSFYNNPENPNDFAVTSKADEQSFLSGSKFGIPTVTIGGKQLYPDRPMSKLDDMNDGDSLPTETRRGNFPAEGDTLSVSREAKFLTYDGKKKLHKKLDKKFGKNNWILKPDFGLQSIGILNPSDPNDVDENGVVKADIPIDKNYFYIAQEKVKANIGRDRNEIRISARVGPDGKLNLLPGSVVRVGNNGVVEGGNSYMEGAWNPVSAFPPELNQGIREMIDELNTLGINLTPGATYGFDVAILDDGSLKIFETNPITDAGGPGNIMDTAGGLSGLAANAANLYSLEEAMSYVSWLTLQGQTEAAARIYDKAVKNNGLSPQDIPEAQQLKQRGVFFANVDRRSVTEKETRDLFKQVITSNNNPTVENYLEALASHSDPRIAKIASDMLAKARQSGNSGLKSQVVIRNQDLRYDDNTKTTYILPADPHLALHEFTHALLPRHIDPTVDLYSYQKITGKQHRALLEDRLKNSKNPKEVNVILDYISAVEGMGFAEKVFGENYVRTGYTNPDVPYGLGSIHEFMAETMGNPKFANELKKIKNPVQRSLFRKLLESVLSFVRDSLFPDGSSAKNLFDKSYNDILELINQDDVPDNQWSSMAQRAQNQNLYYQAVNLRSDLNRIIQRGSTSRTAINLIGRLQKRLMGLTSYDAATKLSIQPNLSVTDVVKLMNPDGNFKRTQFNHGVAVDPFSRSFDSQSQSLAEGFVVGHNWINGVEYSYLFKKGKVTPEEAQLLRAANINPKDIVEFNRENIIHYTHDNSTNPQPNYQVINQYEDVDKTPVGTSIVISDVTHPDYGKEIVVPGNSSPENIERQIAIARGVELDSRNPQFQDQNFNGHHINPQALAPRERAIMFSNVRRKNSGEKLPSDMEDQLLKDLSDKSQRKEIAEYIRAFPSAFTQGKNKKYDGSPITNLQEAEDILVDWLMDNPDQLKHIGLSSKDKNKKSAKRKKEVRRFNYYVNRLNLKNAKGIINYQHYTEEVNAAIRDVLDYITNLKNNPEELTDRQLMALNIAMKNFVNSNGENIRGFAPFFEKINNGRVNSKLGSLVEFFTRMGIKNPFGMPITDFVSNLPFSSKTGARIADVSSDILAIFRRKEARDFVYSLISPFRFGITQYKKSHEDAVKYYNDALNKLKINTRLSTYRVGLAQLLTQYYLSHNTDRRNGQVRGLVRMANESIFRKESITPSKRVRSHTRNAPIERRAFDELVGDIYGNLDNMTYDQIIDHIEKKLTPNEREALRLTRDFGSRYQQRLLGIHQLARGKNLELEANYVKRNQVPLNHEPPANVWGEAAIQNARSVLQPRKGLGEGEVFDLDFRSNFDYQIKETLLEAHTGLYRTALFNVLQDQTFGDLLDNKDGKPDPSLQRTKRLRNVIGNTWSNLINPSVKFGGVIGLAMNALQTAWQVPLISMRAPANQLIPMASLIGTHPVLSSQVMYYRLLHPQYRRNAENFLRNLSPDLYNRLGKGMWDEVNDRLTNRYRFQSTGLHAKNSIPGLIEEAYKAYDLGVGSATSLITLMKNQLLKVTNGYSEVFTAKNVFLTLYINDLIKRGIITDAEQFFQESTPVINQDRIQSMTAAAVEFDTYTVAPISGEERSEFSQRNAAGKVLANLMFGPLSRTRIQQAVKNWQNLQGMYSAYQEYGNTKSPESKDYFNLQLKDWLTGMINNVAYNSISVALFSLYGAGLANLAYQAIIASLAGEPEDEDYWKKKFAAQLEVERDKQRKSIQVQFLTDLSLGTLGLPTIAQSNVANSVVQNSFRAAYEYALRDGMDIDEDLKQMRSLRDELRKNRKNVFEAGLTNYETMNKSLMNEELLNYVENVLLKEKEEYNQDLQDVLTKIGHKENQRMQRDMMVQNIVARALDDVSPATQFVDWSDKLAGAFTDIQLSNMMSQSERAKMSKDRVQSVTENYGFFSLENFLYGIPGRTLSIDNPQYKAAKKTIKEWANIQVDRELSEREKQAEMDRILNPITGGN